MIGPQKLKNESSAKTTITVVVVVLLTTAFQQTLASTPSSAQVGSEIKAQPGSAVQVYLTRPAKNEKSMIGLERQTDLSFRELNAIGAETKSKAEPIPDSNSNSNRENPSAIPIVFTVNASDVGVRGQTVDGFGAALTESCAINLMKLNRRERRKVLERVFSKTSGAGFDYIRLPIGASDFADANKPFYSYDDSPGNKPDPNFKYFSMARDEKTLALIREARIINPNLRVMISPWSPPAWMKTSNSLIAGSLMPEHYQDFANYLVFVTREYLRRGIPVTDLTIQNEPFYDSNSYPSMAMPTDDQMNVIRDFVGPTLKRANLPIRIFIMDHNWDLAPEVNRMLDDAATKRYVGGVSYHCYAGNRWQMNESMTKHPDVPTMQTECSGTMHGNQVGDFHWWLENQSIGAINMGTTGSIGWNLCLDEWGGPNRSSCADCRGMLTTKIKNEKAFVKFNGEFHALAQVSRFIQPGSKHLKISVESGNESELKPENAAAFLNQDGSVAFVVHNPSGKPARFRVIHAEGQRAVDYNLPPMSAVTLTWRL